MLGWLRRLRRPPSRPTPWVGSASANDATRAAFADAGDDGSALRIVEHFAYPDATLGASASPVAETLAQTVGMDVASAGAEGGLVMTHRAAILGAAFDDLTARMEREFAAIGWSYDGWGCPVVTDPDARTC